MASFGRYEIIAELGRGGMAQVFHARDPQFDREVAVKVLPREFLHDPQFRARFEREARALAALEHKAIVPVYDLGEEDGQPYLVMAYMAGGSLAERIQQGAISLQATSTTIATLAPALDLAHQQGMIHRDIKPGNILFDRFDNAHISDFGIVRLTEATSQLTGQGMLGTPSYMAPELADDGEPSYLVDIYALGVVVYQMLSGSLPYDASTPMGQMAAHVTRPIPDIRAVNPFLPPATQHVIDTALAKRPEERYQSAQDLSEGLGELLAYQAEPTHPPAAAPEFETQPIDRYSLESAAPVDTPALDDHDSTIATQQLDVQQTSSRKQRRLPLAMIGALFAGLIVVGGITAAAVIIPRLNAPPAATSGTDIPSSESAPGEDSTPESATLEPTHTPGGPTLSVEDPTFNAAATGIPALMLAETGVTNNAEWQQNDWWPYTQEFDGVQMALIPAGCFMMGSTNGDADESPIHEVCFKAPFWVDVYEVTNEQFGEVSPMCSYYFSEPDQPYVCITSFAAMDYCVSRGARLPTEAEWEYAARGPDSLTYPWGSEFVTGHLVQNTSEPEAVGSRPEGSSWVGALDMSGNVSEWVWDWYADVYYQTLADGVINPQGPDQHTGTISSRRPIRGGSWGDSGASAFRAAARSPQIASGNSYIIGFRCVRDYES